MIGKPRQAFLPKRPKNDKSDKSDKGSDRLFSAQEVRTFHNFRAGRVAVRFGRKRRDACLDRRG